MFSFLSPEGAGFDRLVVRVRVRAAALQLGTEAFFTFAGHSRDEGQGQEVLGAPVLRWKVQNKVKV